MNSNTTRGACALLFSLAFAGTAPAQQRARTVFVGNGECQVTDTAFARAAAGATPVADLQLAADGVFLDYPTRSYQASLFVGRQGSFYSVEAHAAGGNGGGGSFTFRIGGSTVSTVQVGFARPWATRLNQSLQQNLSPWYPLSKTYWVGGLPVWVSGNISIRESHNLLFTINAGNAAPAIIEGTMSGEATGSVSAQLAVPTSGFTVQVSQDLRFGKQAFNGKVEAYTNYASSALAYTLSPVSLVLTLSTAFWGFPVGWLSPVNSSHPGMSLASFM